MHQSTSIQSIQSTFSIIYSELNRRRHIWPTQLFGQHVFRSSVLLHFFYFPFFPSTSKAAAPRPSLPLCCSMSTPLQDYSSLVDQCDDPQQLLKVLSSVVTTTSNNNGNSNNKEESANKQLNAINAALRSCILQLMNGEDGLAKKTMNVLGSEFVSPYLLDLFIRI